MVISQEGAPLNSNLIESQTDAIGDNTIGMDYTQLQDSTKAGPFFYEWDISNYSERVRWWNTPPTVAVEGFPTQVATEGHVIYLIAYYI